MTEETDAYVRGRKRKDAMAIGWLVLIVVGYFALMRWVLPALGVPT